MSLGLGKMLGIGILGNIFGGNENQGLLQQNQQQPTQVANSGQNQGFFPNMNNMSQSQWANTAIALNSMRLEPDANLAAAMRENIASANKEATAQTGRERTANALRGMISDEYPNGRVDLAEAVLSGALPPTDAMKMAYERVPMSAFAEKQQWLQDNPNATDKDLRLAGFSVPEPDAFMRKYNILTDPDNKLELSEEQRNVGLDNLLGTAITSDDFAKKIIFFNELQKNDKLTPDMLELVGIATADQPEFLRKMNELQKVAKETGMSSSMLLTQQSQLLSSMTPDNGKTNKMLEMDYRAKEAGLVAGSQDYKDFFLNFGGGDTIDIKVDTGVDTDAYKAAVQKHMSEQDILQINGARDAFMGIQKLDQVLEILGEIGDAPGIAADWRLQVDRVMADLGLSKEAAKKASYMQRLEALLGSDVFGMIKILGIGARGLDTPAERDFLIAVMTGTIKMTPETIYQMTLYRRKYAEAIINEYNKRVESGYFANYQENARKLELYTIPDMPQVQIKTVDQIITPERADILRLYGLE